MIAAAGKIDVGYADHVDNGRQVVDHRHGLAAGGRVGATIRHLPGARVVNGAGSADAVGYDAVGYGANHGDRQIGATGVEGRRRIKTPRRAALHRLVAGARQHRQIGVHHGYHLAARRRALQAINDLPGSCKDIGAGSAVGHRGEGEGVIAAAARVRDGGSVETPLGGALDDLAVGAGQDQRSETIGLALASRTGVEDA